MFEFIQAAYKNIVRLPDLIIEQGKTTTLIGASGGGKTTVLRLLNKMISPTSGQILYQGVDMEKLDTVTHRRQVTMLSQNPVIFPGTIKENLTIGLRFQNKLIPDDERLKLTLEQVRLPKELDGSAHTLSGGEKQRLALGRLLLLEPEVYLLDEPSAALDEATEETVIQMIVDVVKLKEKTLVMVTHSKAIANNYSDLVIEI